MGTSLFFTWKIYSSLNIDHSHIPQVTLGYVWTGILHTLGTKFSALTHHIEPGLSKLMSCPVISLGYFCLPGYLALIALSSSLNENIEKNDENLLQYAEDRHGQ